MADGTQNTALKLAQVQVYAVDIVARVMMLLQGALLIWGALALPPGASNVSYTFIGQLVPVEAQIAVYWLPVILPLTVPLRARLEPYALLLGAFALSLYIGGALARVITTGVPWQTFTAFGPVPLGALFTLLVFNAWARRDLERLVRNGTGD